MSHRKFGYILEITERFGITLQKVDNSSGVWRVWDINGRQHAIKLFRRGVSSLVLGVNVHEKAGERAPGLLPTLLKASGNFPFLYYRGSHYIGMNWVVGRNLDYLQISDRLRALHALVRWKNSAQGMAVPGSLQLWRKRRVILEERIHEMKECRKMAQRLADDFSRAYLKEWEFYYRQACMARSLLETDEYGVIERSSEQRREICHHDWAHHNLISRPDGDVVVLDLEYVKGDIGISDFIDLLYRFLQLDKGSPSAIPLFFHWLKKIQPLTMEELKCFQVMFMWPEAYWMSGRQHFIEQIDRYGDLAVRRYLRKVPRPEYWGIWQETMAETLGLT